MRVPAITFGLVVALVLALGAVWFTGCGSHPSPHRLVCAQTAAAQYTDEDGNAHAIVFLACEN